MTLHGVSRWTHKCFTFSVFSGTTYRRWKNGQMRWARLWAVIFSASALNAIMLLTLPMNVSCALELKSIIEEEMRNWNCSVKASFLTKETVGHVHIHVSDQV